MSVDQPWRDGGIGKIEHLGVSRHVEFCADLNNSGSFDENLLVFDKYIFLGIVQQTGFNQIMFFGGLGLQKWVSE